MMRFISLFAGIGGFDLGLERAGMTPVLQVERDKNALSVLSKYWSDVPKMEDVRNVTRDTFTGTVDLLCGGFPCQDVSVAGRREGLAGERSGLWFEFIRIIAEFRPQWVIIENVPGLLSSNGGRDMGTIVGALADCGYWWAYRVLDAQYWGVAQRRRRVFIIASLTRGCPQEVLFECEGSPWDTPPSRETGAEIAGTLAPGAHPGGFNGRDAESGMLVSSFSAGNSGDSYGVAYSENVTPPLRAGNSGTNQVPTIAWDGRNFNDTGTVTNTLQSKKNGYSLNYQPLVGVRRLTPIECERLQGFPDGWSAGQSDSIRYRQLGNAVAVPVVEWLGKQIIRAIALT